MTSLSGTAEDLAAIHAAMGDAQDRIDNALAKANAIVFVLSQMPEPPVDLHDQMGKVLWAVSDFLHDAREDVAELHDLHNRYVIAVDPDRERAEGIRKGRERGIELEAEREPE